MLTEKDYCDYGLIVELEQLEMPIEIDFACGIENGQLVKTKFYPNPPTLWEAQKWLREERNIDVLPRRGCITNDKQRYQVVIYINYNRNQILLDNDGEDYSSPEEALSEGIKEAIKILKEKYDKGKD